jgi:hypothetical protein
MKKAALFAGCLWTVALLHGQTGSDQIERTFVSPDGSLTAAVAAQTSASSNRRPPSYSLGAINNGSFLPFRQLPPSVYFAEYHGTAWFEDIEPRWMDNRFLIFQDKFGLAIADVQNRQLLADHVFTAYEKSPVGDKWAAIRLRATGRHQPRLSDDFQDTVLIIDPYHVANQIGNATEANFVGQMAAVNPGGIVLAKPEWAPDGSAFAVLTWNRGAVEAVRYDANLNETGRTAVNLQVGRESALSLSLNTNLSQTAKRILSDPTTFESASPSSVPQTTYSPHQ